MEMESLEGEPEQKFDLMEYWMLIVERKGILQQFFL
jgi:hypothetical protein